MIDLLIISSCIRPVKQDFLKLNDWEERYKQTIESLKFYILSGCFTNIVICDGSGFDLRDDDIVVFARKYNVTIEPLAFMQNYEMVKSKGKGFGEGEIMKFIVSNSQLYKKSESFIKVTGRLIIRNIKEIVERLIADSIYFNIIVSKVKGSVDTRVYAMPTAMYNSFFIDAYTKVDDNIGQTYEIIFGNILQINGLKYNALPKVPVICGYSGTDNKQYKKDATYYASVILTKIGLMNTDIALLVLGIIKVFVKFSKRI